MQLEGACHCGKVTFKLASQHPYPFNICYCTVCRKTAGGGGYAINLGGDSATLKVRGRKFVKIYRAMVAGEDGGRAKRSPAERHFCGECGSALWVWDPRWPELIHPFASAIDTELPMAPERTHLMLAYKASWVPLVTGTRDQCFEHYPQEAIAQWHQRLGLATDDD
jgi:hypothetical protein